MKNNESFVREVKVEGEKQPYKSIRRWVDTFQVKMGLEEVWVNNRVIGVLLVKLAAIAWWITRSSDRSVGLYSPLPFLIVLIEVVRRSIKKNNPNKVA